jgi:hypothetical protein
LYVEYNDHRAQIRSRKDIVNDPRAAGTAVGGDQRRLSFAKADLLSDAGWPEAMAGCRFVLHCPARSNSAPSFQVTQSPLALLRAWPPVTTAAGAVPERLKALAVEPEALAAGIEYRVDEKARRLVPLTPPRNRRTRRTASAGSKRRTTKT